MKIKITKAQQQDAKSLSQVSKVAFEDDVNYGAPQKGGPPGYASVNWHLRMILSCEVYKIVTESGNFVGGIIVYEKGFQHMELGRMFIHPDFQNQSIGRQAILFLEETYPETKLWTLDTPTWNKRNQHFYQKMGYELTGQQGPGGLWFAKQRP